MHVMHRLATSGLNKACVDCVRATNSAADTTN